MERSRIDGLVGLWPSFCSPFVQCPFEPVHLQLCKHLKPFQMLHSLQGISYSLTMMMVEWSPFCAHILHFSNQFDGCVHRFYTDEAINIEFFFWWSWLLQDSPFRFGLQGTSFHNLRSQEKILLHKDEPACCILLALIFLSPFSYHRKCKYSLSSGLTQNLWNIFSTSQITAMGCLRNLQSTPVSLMVRSGPVSKWSFRPVPSYLVE